MKVSIVGTGNVATQLAMGLEHQDFTVDEVYGRNTQSLKQLVQRLYVSESKTDLDFSESEASLIFICVSDVAIAEVAKEIQIPQNCILVHTSGSMPLDLLSKYHDRVGVFYPLQSISKHKTVDWSQVPIIVHAEDPTTLKVLKKVASVLSKEVYVYDDAQRKALHLAAVFGSNFTNHLLKIVKDISEAEGLDFHMFRSLVQNTVEKAFDIGPEQGQTGPAIRNDKPTMQKHMDMLEGSQDLERIYELMSKHIIQTYR